MWCICVHHIQLWAVALSKLPSETNVAIISTNIRPVIIENIVQFSGLGLPRGRCPECHKMPFKSLMLCSWEQRFYPGTTWASIEDDYTKKDRAFSVSWGERVFSQHPRSKYSRMLADRPENWTHQLWSHVIFDDEYRVGLHHSSRRAFQIIPSVSWTQQSTGVSTAWQQLRNANYSCRGWLWTHPSK